jgi:large conductance mechanosensitive channel
MEIKSEVKVLEGAAVGLLQEFRQFIARGNVVDLAVGVIIGGAFGQITTSMVKDIIMPPIGYFTSGLDFSKIKYVMQEQVMAPSPQFPTDPTKDIVVKPEVAIAYGDFLNTVINFLIVAFVIFWIVKSVNLLKRHDAEKPADPPVPSAEEKLLIEIRDLLAKQKA